MFNVLEFKKAVKSLGRKASNIDEFCKEVSMYMEADKKVADNRKLQSLDRRTNHLGETYIFGKFGTGTNSVMITIAYLGKNAQDDPETLIERDYRAGVPITLSEVERGVYRFPEIKTSKKKAVREKVVNIYTFEELSPEMQSKVLDNYRDINVDHDWYDSDIDFWANKLAEMGWGDAEIAFSGFGSQGDGASFTAKNIDIQKLIKTYGVTDQFSNIYTHDVKADITRSGRYVHENSTNLSFEDYSEETPESEKELAGLEKFLTAKMRELNHEIYTDLEKGYEYLTSDEAVKETILANDYEFGENGKIEASKNKKAGRVPNYNTPQTPKQIKERLEYLRGEIEAERISYGEILELQSLSDYIDPSDVVLREWAGLPETKEASKKKADYQGWRDYNTWNMALWLDQDQFELPEEITDIHEAADYIKERVEEENPLSGTFSTYSDILGNALLNIDYREIAENILSSR